MSQPTYINSTTSISEPIKPFDGLDHKYTPEEYIQHIEARVTISLGLQPTSELEHKFLHARRMAFLQCSLTGHTERVEIIECDCFVSPIVFTVTIVKSGNLQNQVTFKIRSETLQRREQSKKFKKKRLQNRTGISTKAKSKGTEIQNQ